MILSEPYLYTGVNYALSVLGSRVTVRIENNVYAVLDVRCAVPKTNDANDGLIEDDNEAAPELASVTERDGAVVFVWNSVSALWEKTYTLTCTRLRFRFDLTVRGQGRVDAVRYFSGDGHGSDYEFQDGFTPSISWFDKEDYYFKASVGCHRWSVLMVPPMFCYAFRCEGLTRRLGLGLVAQPGCHNFQSFDYKPMSRRFGEGGFCLATDQLGHETVDGVWQAPAIIGYGAEDEWEVCRRYSDYYFSSGAAVIRPEQPRPRFWYGPLACGWIQQCVLCRAQNLPPFDLAREDVYEEIVRRLRDRGLRPSALIVDDKWQSHYATDEADPAKFPNLRAYVERRRAEGIRTLLWFKLWDPDGLPENAPLITADNGEKSYDPSSPEFLEILDKALYRILSADEGCYNCDGMKLDYAFHNPIGRGVKTVSGKYGVELLYDLQKHIYETSKSVKPEAMINCSPCHPYFAHICDQGRLHDYNQPNRDTREDMTMRARLYAVAMPGVLLDTDNAGFNTVRDTMRWMTTQDLVGVPDIYSLEPTPSCALSDEDFAAIADTWREYSARMDALHGKDVVR